MEKKPTKFKYIITEIKSSVVITTSSQSINAITFINKSANNTPIINGYPIAPGESLTLSGNEYEVDDTIYNVTIPDTGTPNFWTITKFNFFQ